MRKKGGYASFHGTGSFVAQLGIDTFRVSVTFGEPRRCYTTCWLWVVLVFLPSIFGVCSADDASEGNCRYDLTSVAVLSCLHPNGELRPPSLSCCKALLHAIDHVPASIDSGACCLCRYMRDKEGPPELATAYVRCKGKDSHIVGKWSPFPLAICSLDCRRGRNSSPGMDKDHKLEHSHSTDKAKGISLILWAVVVFILMGLYCFWYLWRINLAANANEQGERLSLNGDHRADHKRSPGPSSTKRKDRRF